MSERIKQMLNMVRQDYGATNYISSERKEVHRAQKLNDLCDRGPGDIDYAQAAKFSYQSPRDPDTWKRPGHDRNWHDITGNFDTPDMDPVDAAMGAFRAAQNDKRRNEHNSSMFGSSDHPKTTLRKTRSSKRQKITMPEDEFSIGRGESSKGRKSGWLSFLRGKSRKK